MTRQYDIKSKLVLKLLHIVCISRKFDCGSALCHGKNESSSRLAKSQRAKRPQNKSDDVSSSSAASLRKGTTTEVYDSFLHAGDDDD
jgi:hypothetical protein